MTRSSAMALLVLAAAVAGPALCTPAEDFDPGGPTSPPLDPRRMLDYGFALQLDRPYQEPGAPARATLFFFNLTPQDADGGGVPVDIPGCLYRFTVRDDKGRAVWRHWPFDGDCPLGLEGMPRAPEVPFAFPAGSFRQLPFDLPMVYQFSETADPDGEPLPGGRYDLEARHLYRGPVHPDGTFMGGGDPRARVPFRVLACGETAQTGSLPMRDLGSGETSGYRYGDPTFYGDTLVLRTEEAALAFWEEHTSNRFPPPKPPNVDFRTEMVIVALLGYQSSGGGPSIEILSVEEGICHLTAGVFVNHFPGPLDVITNPFHAVAVPRSLKEVRVIHAVVTR